MIWGKFILNFLKLLVLFVPLFFLFSLLAYSLKDKFPIDKLLKKAPFGVSHFIAALFGALTPFCSCITLPIFINFIQLGVDLGSAVSFLIASPLVSISAALLIASLFGAKFAAYYITSVILVSIAGGILIGRFKLASPAAADIFHCSETTGKTGSPRQGPLSSAASLFRKLFLYLIIGAGLGALLHDYLPVGIVEKLNLIPVWVSVPIVALIGFPLYANILVVVPVCFSLVDKGVSTAVVATFLVSSCGMSLPTIAILGKIFERRLLAAFLMVTFFAYVAIGYVFYFLR